MIMEKKMTSIMQHNQNIESDKLYQPLREILTRKTAQQYSQEIYSTDQSSFPLEELKNSPLSQEIKLIKPEHIEQMKNNILIPQTRKLIPTTDIQKIEGKQFKAMDVNVREFRPITSQQLEQKLRKKSVCNSILYKFDTKSSSQQTRRMSHASYQKSEKTLPTQYSPKQKATPVFLKEDSITYADFDEKISLGKGLLLQDKIHESSSKLRKRRKPQGYKYNLFSVLDAPVNTKCETWCGNNELIAQRPRREQWR